MTDTRSPHDRGASGTALNHRIFLAADTALAGAPGPLEALERPPPDLPNHYRFLLELAEALRCGLAEGDGRAAWRAARPL